MCTKGEVCWESVEKHMRASPHKLSFKDMVFLYRNLYTLMQQGECGMEVENLEEEAKR